MENAVRLSAMAFRAFWVINLLIGVFAAFTRSAPAWVGVHVAIGMVIVILLFFLGLPQALGKGGSLVLMAGTFMVGLGVALIGMTQTLVTNLIAFRIIQTLHIFLVVSAIALAEICVRRYFGGLAAQRATTSSAQSDAGSPPA
ncbi:MAG TPA: hypothetical protein VF808_00790 [Ktedonobacterales bacterium]